MSLPEKYTIVKTHVRTRENIILAKDLSKTKAAVLCGSFVGRNFGNEDWIYRAIKQDKDGNINP